MKVSVRMTNDFYSILALNDIIFPGEDLDVRDGIHGWIARCSHSQKQVGFCTLTDIGCNIAFLSRAGVLRCHRGRNLQKRLIRVRENFAKKNGFKKVITYVHKRNYASLVNLIKMGYCLYVPEYNYAGDDFIYLMKAL